jgi:hypothetical protein
MSRLWIPLLVARLSFIASAAERQRGCGADCRPVCDGDDVAFGMRLDQRVERP